MPTTISWTNETWNPTTGCDKVSPGCDHCYALGQAPRLKAMAAGRGSGDYQTDGDPRTSGPGFGLMVYPDRLDIPLHWRAPRRVFVNSMSDLFHPKVSDDFLARAFAVMGLAEQHTFQVLTKRPARMRALLTSEEFRHAWYRARHVRALQGDVQGGVRAGRLNLALRWPLPNVWLGVSVEDQERADARIGALLNTPAAVRFLSAEPLLGPIDLYSAAIAPLTHVEDESPHEGPIDWLIIGGESGPGARPMDLGWARYLVGQALAAGTAVWVKQLGSVLARERGIRGKGEHLDDLPEDLRIREFPE
jgi:protein gp37